MTKFPVVIAAILHFLAAYSDCPGIPIDSDMLPAVQALGCHACAKNGGNVILAGHDGAVAERASDIGNDACGKGEEWRPGGRCDPGDQDIAWPHLLELVGTMNDSRQPADTTCTGTNPFN